MPRPLPSDASIGHRAAVAFHNAAAHCLVATARGKGYQREIAAIVGGGEQGYSDAQRGKHVTIDRVHRWLVEWNGTDGLPQLRMVLESDDVVIEVKGEDQLAFGATGPRALA